jgi:hypothetical protein
MPGACPGARGQPPGRATRVAADHSVADQHLARMRQLLAHPAPSNRAVR